MWPPVQFLTRMRIWNDVSPVLQNGKSAVETQLYFISYEWVDHIAVYNYMFRYNTTGMSHLKYVSPFIFSVVSSNFPPC